MRKVALALPILLLAACAATPQPPGYTALVGCDATASILEKLTVQRRAGLLDPELIAQVNTLKAVADPICTAPVPPANADLIIQHVLDELEIILLLSLSSDEVAA